MNYINLPLRNMLRNKTHSIISIIGLAIGLAACILILLFVRYEFSFDNWIPEAKKIFKLEVTFHYEGRQPVITSKTQLPASSALLNDYSSAIESVVRILDLDVVIEQAGNMFRENVLFADRSFFDVLDIPLISGDSSTALLDPSNILISQSMAAKYFDDIDSAIGEILTITRDSPTEHRVVGVFRDIPGNSHFQADFLAVLDTNREALRSISNRWGITVVHTYIKLKDGIDHATIESDFQNFSSRHTLNEFPPETATRLDYNLIALNDIHLFGDKPNHLQQNGDINTVLTFAMVSVFILGIAIVNFVNLSTAISLRRAKEIGIRKVVGASRRKLVLHFLGESISVTLVALIVALLLVEIALPIYSELLQSELSFSILGDPFQSVLILVIAVITGLISGFYPALFLSSFSPANSLKSGRETGAHGNRLRNCLVVFQFSISLVLIISSAIVYAQIAYASNIDLGFEESFKVNLLNFDQPEVSSSITEFKQKLSGIAAVRNITMSNRVLPFSRTGPNMSLSLRDDNISLPSSIEGLQVSANFFDFYEIDPISGRLFSENIVSDTFVPLGREEARGSAGMIVNRSFLEQYGLTLDDALDEIFVNNFVNVDFTLIGVIPDAYFRSLRYTSTPMFMLLRPEEQLSVMTIDLLSANYIDGIEALQSAWQETVPNYPIEMRSMEDDFSSLYYDEELEYRILSMFSLLAIIISCLGVYGLVAFTIEAKSHQIAVRKVIGASAINILKLLLWQFTRPILLACAIGGVAAMLVMNYWLETYAYRVDLLSQWTTSFLLGCILMIAIAWSVMVSKILQVSLSNPVNALRSE